MDQNVRVDKICWHIYQDKLGGRNVQPTCPSHGLRLYPILQLGMRSVNEAVKLKCEDCDDFYKLPRNYRDEKQYVLDRVDARVFKSMKVLNLDDEALPLAEDKVSSEDSKYFVKALLTKSKLGLRLVVYAGEKGRKEKTQIFVEPEIKRLAFDQTNLHPNEVFTKLEATFTDGAAVEFRK